MDILKVLERFQAMNENEQAWVMSTLLDFRQQHLDKFERAYGTIAKNIIAALVMPGE